MSKTAWKRDLAKLSAAQRAEFWGKAYKKAEPLQKQFQAMKEAYSMLVKYISSGGQNDNVES
jgi:hypothetical protein